MIAFPEEEGVQFIPSDEYARRLPPSPPATHVEPFHATARQIPCISGVEGVPRVILRMRWLAVSATITLPLASIATPVGALNCADTPVPSKNPVVDPAKVLTTPVEPELSGVPANIELPDVDSVHVIPSELYAISPDVGEPLEAPPATHIEPFHATAFALAVKSELPLGDSDHVEPS